LPRLSIGIPAYNAARYLEDTLRSALAQDHPDYEVVVCDNVSTDETRELCARVADPRFRYVRFEAHLEQPGNWNRCLEQTGGEYVVLLHADDLLAPAFLGRAERALDSHPAAGFVHSAVTHIDTAGRPLWQQRLHAHDQVDDGDVFFERLLLEGCLVNPAGVLLRRSAYARAGPFNEDVLWAADWDMWLRLSLLGSVAYIAETLASYREHSASGTAGVVKSARNGRDELAVVESVFRRVPGERPKLLALRPAAVARVAHRTWCWAEEACRQGQGRAARSGVIQALRMYPRMALQVRVWALLLASYIGYGSFQRALAWKRRLSGGV
jgi:glycosyltransferase involved in cell wall biosynthesis